MNCTPGNHGAGFPPPYNPQAFDFPGQPPVGYEHPVGYQQPAVGHHLNPQYAVHQNYQQQMGMPPIIPMTYQGQGLVSVPQGTYQQPPVFVHPYNPALVQYIPAPVPTFYSVPAGDFAKRVDEIFQTDRNIKALSVLPSVRMATPRIDQICQLARSRQPHVGNRPFSSCENVASRISRFCFNVSFGLMSFSVLHHNLGRAFYGKYSPQFYARSFALFAAGVIVAGIGAVAFVASKIFRCAGICGGLLVVSNHPLRSQEDVNQLKEWYTYIPKHPIDWEGIKNQVKQLNAEAQNYDRQNKQIAAVQKKLTDLSTNITVAERLLATFASRNDGGQEVMAYISA